MDLANRIERVNLVRHTVNRTRKVEVHELKVVREPYSQFVELDPDGPEWDFYQRVTAAIREYAWERGVNDGFLLAPPQRQVSSCMYAAARSWLDKSGVSDLTAPVYEDLGADDVGLMGGFAPDRSPHSVRAASHRRGGSEARGHQVRRLQQRGAGAPGGTSRREGHRLWVRLFWNDAERQQNSDLASWQRENTEDGASYWG